MWYLEKIVLVLCYASHLIETRITLSSLVPGAVNVRVRTVADIFY